jgi:hypothetical protein
VEHVAFNLCAEEWAPTALKMEAAHSSETMVSIYETTTLHNLAVEISFYNDEYCLLG